VKQFLIKVSFFLLSICLTLFLLIQNINGYSDSLYLRFTTPKQTSLILGTSRAAQGIQPSVLNHNFPEKEFYNFSFTLGHSRYGPNYLHIIHKKLKDNSRNGIFILSVDPWSISCYTEEGNDSTLFQELDLEVNIPIVDMNPNLVYLLRNHKGPIVNLIFRKDSTIFLHNDGWLETSPGMDSLSLHKNLTWKIKNYREQNLPRYKFSSIRFHSLSKTIEFLKTHGEVYLVRLPIHPLMMNIETELMPSFTKKIDSIAHQSQVSYFDLTYLNSQCNYTDGNHIHKSSAGFVTQTIADWIKKN